MAGGAEPQEGGGLARAWTTHGLKVLGTNAPMKRQLAQRGQWPWNSDFASFLLLILTCHYTTRKSKQIY